MSAWFQFEKFGRNVKNIRRQSWQKLFQHNLQRSFKIAKAAKLFLIFVTKNPIYSSAETGWLCVAKEFNSFYFTMPNVQCQVVHFSMSLDFPWAEALHLTLLAMAENLQKTKTKNSSCCFTSCFEYTYSQFGLRFVGVNGVYHFKSQLFFW